MRRFFTAEPGRVSPAPIALALLVAACGGASPHTIPAVAAPAQTASVPAPTPHAVDDADDAAIAAAGKDYVDLLVDLSPEHATWLGLHARDGELDDRTKEGAARALEKKKAMLEALHARFAQPKASMTARTDLAILEGALEVSIRAQQEERPLERSPLRYEEPLEALFVMFARDYAPAKERATNAIARLEKLSQTFALARQNLENPPAIWTEIAIERAAGAQDFLESERAPLHAALPAEGARVDAAVDGAKSAFAAYADWLKKDLLPRSHGDFAAGKEYFDWRLHHDYFLDIGSDEILAMGKAIFDKTLAQMDEVAKRIDPKAKGWPEVTARVKAHHPTADDLIPSYRREVARARQFLVDKDAVPFPPDDELQVLETPPFQRTTITAAYDAPPPFDASTKGFFYVTPVDKTLPAARQEQMLRENDHGDEVDTAVHEAYPGHHLQLSFSRRHPSLVRKVTGPDIFAEGWGLYAEELMAELGYYTDEERLMQLEWTLVRAARVIIDVGLHTRGMSFDEAVHILTDQVHLEHELAMSEVKRYTTSPTQPLSYLVGREMIFRMRDRMKAKEGAAFSLKRFHEAMLTHGTLAPGLLEKEVFGP